jgi:hypothetical protein
LQLDEEGQRQGHSDEATGVTIRTYLGGFAFPMALMSERWNKYRHPMVAGLDADMDALSYREGVHLSCVLQPWAAIFIIRTRAN